MIVSSAAYSVAWAEEHERGHEQEHGAEHGAKPVRREPPPKFQAHPPGQHPHGPIVRQHPTRVMAPKVVVHNHREWNHWEHPEFARPVYYWDWNVIHSVSCVAEDSYGDQYPVTESTFAGFGLANMTDVEDDALDRCYAESGADASCFLATCSHF
jgi:hypothetical protein